MALSKYDLDLLFDTFDKIGDANLKGQIGVVLRRAVANFVNPFIPKRVRRSKDFSFTVDEINMLRDGRKIDCIRSVRERIEGLSLLETKRLVEKHMEPYYVAKPLW